MPGQLVHRWGDMEGEKKIIMIITNIKQNMKGEKNHFTNKLPYPT